VFAFVYYFFLFSVFCFSVLFLVFFSSVFFISFSFLPFLVFSFSLFLTFFAFFSLSGFAFLKVAFSSFSTFLWFPELKCCFLFHQTFRSWNFCFLAKITHHACLLRFRGWNKSLFCLFENRETITKIFGNIPILLGLTKQFLDGTCRVGFDYQLIKSGCFCLEMVGRLRDWTAFTRLGDIFLKYIHFFKMYSRYCVKYVFGTHHQQSWSIRILVSSLSTCGF